jgi:4-hydroxy-3-methylbut-2-enyl diphosphate reductase
MQKIRILQPIGWCEGVKQAINNLNKIIKKHKNNIYLIGQLIHNKETMNYYIKKDIKILDGVDRLKLIKSIKNKDATIVFSAHGTSQNIIDYANQHFKHVYDLTCKYVKANYLLVNKLKSQGHSVTYYGNKNHPESIAMKSLGISFKPSKTSILINQTTIPLIKVKKIQQKYKCK